MNYGAGDAEFFEDEQGVYNFVNMRDVWEISYINSQSEERTGYPTQKPLALLDQIIRASSKKGDIVFDPFCGCATTLVVADHLRRDWVGIDISPMATKLVKDRIRDQQGLWQKIVSRDDITQRTDLGRLQAPKTHKRKLFGEQEGKCNGCGTLFNIENLDIDHIIAKSKGRTNHINNLQLLCGHCNSTKGDRGMEYLVQRLKLDEKVLGINGWTRDMVDDTRRRPANLHTYEGQNRRDPSVCRH